MPILQIKKYPDLTLRKKAQKIEKIDDEIRRLVLDMQETLRTSNGLGLAAPQVGVSKRVIVVSIDSNISAFINPQIIQKGREYEKGEEGCLSFPGLYLGIKRLKRIKAKALALNGDEIEIDADGLMARVLQHEIDHLDGRLFFTRLNLWQRWKLRKKLRKFKNNAGV